MTSFNNEYLSASDLAYVRGVDNFDKFMPRKKARNLFLAMLSTKGFKWIDSRFASWLANTAGKLERLNGQKTPPCPSSGKICEWEKIYNEWNIPRPNAYRVEIMEPAPRCGWRLKKNHIGGSFFDYLPCLK